MQLKVLKWVLKNAKHLNEDDTYLIEKITDDCHLDYMQMKNEQESA